MALSTGAADEGASGPCAVSFPDDGALAAGGDGDGDGESDVEDVGINGEGSGSVNNSLGGQLQWPRGALMAAALGASSIAFINRRVIACNSRSGSPILRAR